MFTIEEWVAPGRWNAIRELRQVESAWRFCAGHCRKSKHVTRVVCNGKEVRRAEWVGSNVQKTYDAGSDAESGSLAGDLLSVAGLPFVLVFRIVTSTPVLWCAGFLIGCGIGPFLFGFKVAAMAGLAAMFVSFVKPRACDDAH